MDSNPSPPPNQSLFLSQEFTAALSDSGSIGQDSGWEDISIRSESAFLPLFEKTNSYGEYIFDWAWVDAYHRNRLPYFPKLVSMVPFTPVTTPHFFCQTDDERDLLYDGFAEILRDPKYSSAHFLFTPESEARYLESKDFKIRHSCQYHFLNRDYDSFDSFLAALTSRRRKQIRNERCFSNIRFERLTGADLTDEHAAEMYAFYQSTIEKKGALSYLRVGFWPSVFRNLAENLLYVRAVRDDQCVAGGIFFYDEQRLYGRYWGCREEIRNLHFEVCFYQGIQFCIERGLKVFEAGAQGEHKLPRGFEPVLIYSAHWIRHPQFREAIWEYIDSERKQIALYREEAKKSLPFRTA